MNHTTSGRRVAGAALLAGAALAAAGACKAGPTPQQIAQQQSQHAQAVASSPCPPDGSWKECNLTERLLQAGMGVRLDSAPAKDSAIAQAGVLYHIGRATLEAYFFADSNARKAAAAKLDTSKFIDYMATQVYPPKTSMLQSANLLALLVSQNDAQRQRIGDAITAGAPQPAKK
ncbi:MAG: hypothetical protein KGL93_13345 [Gemmatimonadota bacterium]|nr:hypothetical protein [Gemmatimonadota bacterium]